MKSDNSVAKSWQQLLLQNRVIAVIRSPKIEVGLAMAKAVADGGIKLIEVTWNSAYPAATILRLRSELPHCIVGAGTILNLDQLQEAIAAEAQFIFCPHFSLTLLKTSIFQYQIPLVPGVLTPTEIVTAWQAGATTVKVFPVRALGGARYLKSLRQPLSQIEFIPTGGVTIDNAKAMLDAGAIAIGLSSDLLLPTAVAACNWQEITQRTQTLLSKINTI
ncbi:bifunctional 4-hydroxy-2-oxoglutarate aldolase/2-dehydro-3-deoxy-phosphogluconate aldolase [Myxosarcina sp. GI1]|uniref:bifunctional 4-hydroxy-2-oxoglutarate aldolase/2-dehydro-3-deoxy-phosphogluconate aldolase n=1 Tax=Myxosarcina sp. GI1 TaxID=1541065 RepID=UPI00055C50B2|nr:bifunctional 4-hydroxy-2-oxoglutarate aldolase/2-dehydro-3-deoxy-phosphogluconate aldolase [Myxosarcina sp. GI1]